MGIAKPKLCVIGMVFVEQLLNELNWRGLIC
ncbi:hypothetical protein VCSRO208_3217 [Vibrio cholerae]|nr:hypothetical protein VCG_003176 [Vibrio cholerae 12129(1)]EEO04753.1 hypothetical protein VIF_000233 [Vibrio cholerae TM 11079-80]KFD87273.1 hypothetical protein DN42_2454 [Vibrio cholerae]KFE04934.1 hypothetical protein DN35_2410 [Vibrio cholerae]KFE09027.1 hypothetical protein DN36_1896 [Vibrio cholerae]